MDINQLEKLVQYYDEERRRDRTLLTQIQERVETLLRENEGRSRYTQTLETQMGELKSRLARAEGWTTAIDTARQEFKVGIQRVEEGFKRTDVDAQRVRQVELESVTRQIAEIKRDVKPFNVLPEQIESRKLEDSRLSEMISRLQIQVIDIERRMDQPGAAIAYLEEQRRHDNKRITQVEQELPDLKRKLDTFPPQLLLLDEAVRKKHTEIEEAGKLLEAQSQVIESQRVGDIRRERQFAEYVGTVEKLRQRADEISVQTTGFVQMREEVKREITALPEIQRRLEARINEIFEIQRDAEERAKRQAEGFKDRQEKSWKDFATQQEEKWFERDKRFSEHEGRLDEIDVDLTKIPVLTPFYDILEAFGKAYAMAGREWLSQSNTLIDKAKTAPANEVKFSRRQRRKQAASQADEAGLQLPVPKSIEQEEDPDLLQ